MHFLFPFARKLEAFFFFSPSFRGRRQCCIKLEEDEWGRGRERCGGEEKVEHDDVFGGDLEAEIRGLSFDHWCFGDVLVLHPRQ